MVVDTSVFIEFLRAKEKSTTTLWAIPDGTSLFVSSVTLYELYLGATKPEKWHDVQELLSNIIALPLTKQIAEEAARVYQDLRRRNALIGHRDIFIGSTALVHNLPIKSINEKHFERIKGLVLV